MHKKISTVVVSLLAILSAQAQFKLNTLALDNLVKKQLPNVSPGCVVLIANHSAVIYKKAFGKASLELNTNMQTDMVCRLGSGTKQYTAVAILQLLETRKLSLSDSLQQYIKNFPWKGHTITIENLLTHTSGLTDYEVLDFPIPNAIRVDFPAKQILDSLAPLPLEFEPGTKFQYSNTNYFMLAYIIEQITGKQYKDYLDENILKPAGLTNTHYDSPTEIIPHRINGYAKNSGQYSNAGYISMSQVFGAGALVSNVDDMFKWHKAVYSYKLLKKETLDKAFTPHVLSDGTVSTYGYGWFIKKRNGLLSIEHAGGIDGFQSDEIYFPTKDIFIATLYNSLNEGGGDASFMELDNQIATLVIEGKLPTEVNVSKATLKQYEGTYQFDSTHSLIVTSEGNQLFAEAPAGGLPKSPLFAKTQTVFFLKVIEAEVEFKRERNGEVTEVVTRFNGQSQVSKKIK